MRKKRRVKKVGATATRIYDFPNKTKLDKISPIKPFTKLTKEQMKQSVDFKRRSWERD